MRYSRQARLSKIGVQFVREEERHTDRHASQINERLKLLPPEKLAVVYDFVSYLSERDLRLALKERPSEAYQTMLASEQVLAIGMGYAGRG